MVIRFEFKCPECGNEFFADNIYPKCPRCGYKDKDEGGDKADEDSPEV